MMRWLIVYSLWGFSFKERNLRRKRRSQGAMGYPKGRMQFFPLVAVARVSCAGEIYNRKQSRSLAAELLKSRVEFLSVAHMIEKEMS